MVAENRYSWPAHRGSRGHGCKYSVETCGQSVGCWSYASCFCSVTKWSRRIDGPYNVPRFSSLADSRVYVSAITIGIIASLESLLAIEAVDKIDPRQQRTPRNRELLAQGAGNVICGLFGGLPVSAAVIRGTANVNAGLGHDSRLSHGLLLLTCVLLLPAWLNEIPLSTLAAILIKTGYRLTNPKRYYQLWQEGYSQFIPFVATVLAIVLTDLLVGIGIGLTCSIIFILHSNYRRPLTKKLERHASGNLVRVDLANQVTFFNLQPCSRCCTMFHQAGHC